MPVPGCPALPKISAEWYDNTTLTSIQKQQNAFIFRTKVLGKTFSYAVTFPAIGGVRFTGKKGYFDTSENLDITYSGKKHLKMTAGNMTAVFCKDDARGWVLDILNAANKVVFTFSGDQLLLGFNGNKVKKCVKMRLLQPIAKNEVIYGLGERYNAFNQVGHELILWNADTGYISWACDKGQDHIESYQNVPYLNSDKGYSLFINTMYGARMDFGVKLPHVYDLDFNCAETDFFVYTDEPANNLKCYTDLTGHSIIPPKWAFRYWLGAPGPVWQKNGSDGQSILDVLKDYFDGYEKLGIRGIAAVYGEEGPCRHKICYDLANESGTRMLFWTPPRISEKFCQKVLGTDDIMQIPIVKVKKGRKWVTHSGWLDLTHPNAKTVLNAYFKEYCEWGLRGSMIDFGEFIPPEALIYNGTPGHQMHNEHSLWYGKVYAEVFNELTNNDCVLFSRSACAGSQKYVAQFGGDQESNFDGLRQTFTAGLSLCTCGFNIWGSDIAGFSTKPTPELYKRWLQFSTFSPLMRAHGLGADRNPWLYGDEAVECFKKLYWWRENMLDYIYSNAVHAHLTAYPLMCALPVAFPQEDLAHVNYQYMFGSELLVAPIVEEQLRTHRMVTFPKGNWVNLWTCERLSGDRTIVQNAAFDSIPVYLRAGAAMYLEVAESLSICDSMQDGKRVPVLLTTPADGRREVPHYFDKQHCVHFITDAADTAVTVENPDKVKLEAVLVFGIEADKVLVDGKPADFTADNGKTVIKTPGGFDKIQVLDGKLMELDGLSGYYGKNFHEADTGL